MGSFDSIRFIFARCPESILNFFSSFFSSILRNVAVPSCRQWQWIFPSLSLSFALTDSSMTTNMTAIGFDGGQRQWFRMEIYEQKSGLLQANISSRHPSFVVSGLEAGRLLTIAVYAVNIKGHSDRVILEGFTLKAAEKQMSKFVLSCLLCFDFIYFVFVLWYFHLGKWE